MKLVAKATEMAMKRGNARLVAPETLTKRVPPSSLCRKQQKQRRGVKPTSSRQQEKKETLAVRESLRERVCHDSPSTLRVNHANVSPHAHPPLHPNHTTSSALASLAETEVRSGMWLCGNAGGRSCTATHHVPCLHKACKILGLG